MEKASQSLVITNLNFRRVIMQENTLTITNRINETENKQQNSNAQVKDYWPGWSTHRAQFNVAEKKAMAIFFAEHDFLVRDGGNPAVDERLHSADILINPGTTPDTVTQTCLEWEARYWRDKGPFSTMWHTTGTLAAASLRKFKERNPTLRAAAETFLFPGQVDPDVESVIGEDTVKFIQEQFRTRLRYAILSAYGLDLTTGYTYFHYKSEVSLQKACATYYAAHKFLFLEPSKFVDIEGNQGYSVRDLLETANFVTIYTVDSEFSELIATQFNELKKILQTENEGEKSQKRDKILRLGIIGDNNQLTKNIIQRGQLRKQQIMPS